MEEVPNPCRDHRPVVEHRYTVTRSLDGFYAVTVEHRHYTGEWSSWRDHYVKLTAEELLSCYDALSMGLGFRHRWLYRGEQLTFPEFPA